MEREVNVRGEYAYVNPIREILNLYETKLAQLYVYIYNLSRSLKTRSFFVSSLISISFISYTTAFTSFRITFPKQPAPDISAWKGIPLYTRNRYFVIDLLVNPNKKQSKDNCVTTKAKHLHQIIKKSLSRK